MLPAPSAAAAEGGWSRYAWPLGVVAAVAVANLLPLLGIVDVSPLGPTGAMVTASHSGLLPGQWYTDPNIGWTAQALGHLSAEDWLHGIIPWWNPYEGLGAPLAAEMQAGSFFPPTLLLALPQGQLFFHVALESITGLATWFLVRELGFGRAVATLGGILFALNGTLAWFGNAPANPVAFLPVVILGIERISRRDGRDDVGWLILAAGIALSIYAGFPETAYLDALFAAAWFVFRLAGRRGGGRARFAARVALGGGVGLLVAAPLALAFAGYLPLADVSVHAGGTQFVHLGLRLVPSIGLPYLYGPIAAFSSSDPTGKLAGYFGGTGGFVTSATIALSVVGLAAGRRERGLRILLAALAVVPLMWVFGVPPVQTVLARVVPLASDVLAYRYLAPGWELAFVLLACFGVDAIANRTSSIRRVAITGGVGALAVIGAELLVTWPTVSAVNRSAPGYHVYPVLMVAWAVTTVAAVTVAALAGGGRGATVRSRRLAGGIVAGVLALDALAMFVVPELSAPRSVTVDTSVASYLSSHLGNGRYFSLWVYHPDYGAYFGIASADSDDLPVPKAWAAYVAVHLGRNANPTVFDGQRVRKIDGPSAVQELNTRLAAYEAIAVRYVLARSGTHPFGRGKSLTHGVKQVYDDGLIAIYELPDPRPFFSTTGSPCRLQPSGQSEVVARCDGPATLHRSELAFPGWSATLDGRPVPVLAWEGGLSAVQLPAGTSTVSFAYTPPHTDLALALFAVGMLAVVGIPVATSVTRRRTARS